MERLENRPLTVRAKEALTDSIVNGAFPDGWLPAEDRLARQMGVSRPTLRAAMRSLEEEGLVTRQRGIGTRVNLHVARSRLSLSRAVGFYDLIEEAGFKPSLCYTKVTNAPVPPEAMTRWSHTDETELVQIERLIAADGEPDVHLVEMVNPRALTTRLTDESPMGRSIFELADRYCTRPIDHTLVEIIPVAASDYIAGELEVEVGHPLLRLIETHYDASGEAFIVSLIHLVDRHLRFTVVRRRS